MPSLYLSAPNKSSGKTLVSVGLAAACHARGKVVQTFKKGPDYIDPGWLSLAGRRPCRNLDFHTQSLHEISCAYARHASAADVILVEGTKGLHDGVAEDGSDSNAALARHLATPVVLVIDTRGMTRGVAALVHGMASFDVSVSVAGVILNRVGGPRHVSKLRAALTAYTDLPVLGAVGNDEGLSVAERHLGLTSSAELGDGAKRVVERLAERMAAEVDIDALLACGAACPVPVAAGTRRASRASVRVGVARDAAFCFYYPDNLEALEAAGAELCFFDTLHDTRLPDVDALYFGGGFPETSMGALSANGAMRSAVAAAAARGLPVYAECGGLMYLGRALRSGDRAAPMCGALPLSTRMHKRPTGRGYVRLGQTGLAPFGLMAAGADLPAHEFHYSAIEDVDTQLAYGYRVLRGYGVDGESDGIVHGSIFASYAHLRDTPTLDLARSIVDWARRCACPREGADDGDARVPIAHGL